MGDEKFKLIQNLPFLTLNIQNISKNRPTYQFFQLNIEHFSTIEIYDIFKPVA